MWKRPARRTGGTVYNSIEMSYDIVGDETDWMLAADLEETGTQALNSCRTWAKRGLLSADYPEQIIGIQVGTKLKRLPAIDLLVDMIGFHRAWEFLTKWSGMPYSAHKDQLIKTDPFR